MDWPNNVFALDQASLGVEFGFKSDDNHSSLSSWTAFCVFFDRSLYFFRSSFNFVCLNCLYAFSFSFIKSFVECFMNCLGFFVCL